MKAAPTDGGILINSGSRGNVAPIPYGYGLADIMAQLHGRNPTKAEAEEAADGAIRQFGKGAKAFGLLDASELDGLLDEAMEVAGCSARELAGAAGVAKSSIHSWSKDITPIMSNSYKCLCVGLARAAIDPIAAWRALFTITLSITESDERAVAQIEEAKREQIREAIDKLSGVALDSIYIHAVALADAVSDGWTREVERGFDLSPAQEAVMCADATTMIDANIRLRKCSR